jgi:hypothetical protein
MGRGESGQRWGSVKRRYVVTPFQECAGIPSPPLPWSFVVHDQLWNLIPAPPGVNSAKSNQLPSADSLPAFVALQHQGLVIAQQLLPKASFSKFAEDYLAELHLSSSEALLDIDQLYPAYEQNLGPLLTLAAN